MGEARGGLWEPVHVGHTKLQGSKDGQLNLVHNVYTRDRRGSCFSGTLFEGRKGGQVKCFHRRIAPSQVPIMFNRRTVRVHQIEVEKEGYG